VSNASGAAAVITSAPYLSSVTFSMSRATSSSSTTSTFISLSGSAPVSNSSYWRVKAGTASCSASASGILQ